MCRKKVKGNEKKCAYVIARSAKKIKRVYTNTMYSLRFLSKILGPPCRIKFFALPPKVDQILSAPPSKWVKFSAPPPS